MKTIAALTTIAVLGLTWAFWPTPKPVREALLGTAHDPIRQEVNITDGYMFAASGSYATSSAIAAITDSNYSSPAYYLEVVASTTAGTTASVSLVNATSSATVVSVNITGGNTYALYRSAAFLPNASSTVQYKVRLNNESIGKGIIAARIVIIQNPASLTNTETQIEIGNQETYTSTATSSLASPKYWYADLPGWDGATTTYASVTYANTVEPSTNIVGSSTVYSAAGTYTVNIPGGTSSTSIQLWGGGGSGGAGTVNSSGAGSGGAGGQYAKSTIASLGGQSFTLVVGAGAGTAAGNGTQGATSTWNTSTVKAGGGNGGGQDSGAAGTGNTVGCTGDVCHAGGNGAAGVSGASSGGGGEGSGSGANGGNASGATGGTGTDGGDGAAGQSTNGTPATATAPGGGGGGGRSTGNPNASGGAGGAGKAIITDDINSTITSTTTIAVQEDNGSFGSWTDKAYIVVSGTASSPTLATSSAFTAVNGKHYRLAMSNGYNGATFAIYNAKIVVDQSASGSPTTDTFTSTGTWTAPAGVTSVIVKAWGGGGGGGNQDSLDAFGGGGGGGGGYSENDAISVTPTTGYTVTVGSGGSSNGGDSWFDTSSTILAKGGLVGAAGTSGGGGAGGTGGQSTSGIGSIKTSGGNGSNGRQDSGLGVSLGGGGGGSGGDTTGGGNGVVGGLHTNDTGGAAGTTNGFAGANGNAFGGGGAGGSTATVQSGTAGKVTITYTPNSIITKLEPQYLLANTKLVGTALQNFLTDFDTTEWSTTNNYTLAVSSGASEASTIDLENTSGPTVITGSTVTSPNNYATSTSMCLTSSATLDSKANPNAGAVYSVSIITQVGVTSTATCGPATPLGADAGIIWYQTDN